MPTPNGPIGNPRYDVNDSPQFPVHLTAISDFFAGLVGGTVPTYGDLPNVPAKFPGMRQWVTADSADWMYTGTGWRRIPALVSEIFNNIDTGAQVAASGNILVTAFGALPYATTIYLESSSDVGNRATDLQGGTLWSTNAGTLTQVASRRSYVKTGMYANIDRPATLTLPPNTTASVTLKLDATDAMFVSSFIRARRVAS